MRVLLADDHPEVRSALRLLLQHDTGVTVVGEAADAKGLLDMACCMAPDLVLLDWELPLDQESEDISSLLVALRSCCPGVLVIALSGRPEARRLALASSLGADAFVSKGEPPELLVQTLRALSHRCC